MNTATPLLLMPTAEMVEQKETALAVIPEAKALEVFLEGKGIDELLSACEEKAMAITADASTAKGRAEIKSMAYLVTRTKTAAEAIRKALADEYKEKPKRIDANGKRLRDGLDALQAKVRKPVDDWEAAEKARVQGIKDRIEVMRQHAGMSDDSGMIKAAIARVEAVAIDDSFAELVREASIAKDAALADLRVSLEFAIKREAEAAELARLREEQAKREQEDRDRRIAEAAAEKARRDAEDAAARERAEVERKAKEDRAAAERRELELKLAAEKAERERLEQIERAEREKLAAIEAERRKQEDAERARLAEEARVKAENERRAADLEHREGINRAILNALKNKGVPPTVAQIVVSLLSTGSIPFVTIEY